MNIATMLIAAGLFTAYATILAFGRHGYHTPKKYKVAFVIGGVLMVLGAGLL